MRGLVLVAILVLGCDAAHVADIDVSRADASTIDAFDAMAPAPRECPAQALALQGLACDGADALCGAPCCGGGVSCVRGTWTYVESECFRCDAYVCGDGACRETQTCVARCGPAGGTQYVCVDRPALCDDCSCVALTATQHCELREQDVFVTDDGPCF